LSENCRTRALFADRRPLRRDTIASRDRFRPMEARQNLVLYYKSKLWCVSGSVSKYRFGSLLWKYFYPSLGIVKRWTSNTFWLRTNIPAHFGANEGYCIHYSSNILLIKWKFLISLVFIHFKLVLYHHNLLPLTFCQIFQTDTQIHHYSTRNSESYRSHLCRTNIKNFLYFSKDWKYRTPNQPLSKQLQAFVLSNVLWKKFLRDKQNNSTHT